MQRQYQVIPRFRMDGKYYTSEELPEDRESEIIEKRMDLAMAGIGFGRDKKNPVLQDSPAYGETENHRLTYG